MAMTWLITGTSSGFGRLMAEKLLARGDRVAATARRSDALVDLVGQHGDRLWTAVLDVADTGAVRETVDRAFDELGRVDVVVSNAGYGLFGVAEELDDAAIRGQVGTNLLGSIALIRASLPHLRAQGGGRIVQVSSEGGQCTYPGFSLYHATKFGIEGFVEAVAKEVEPFGVTFILAEPGPSRTNFGAGLVTAEPMPVYGATPVGDMRRVMAEGDFGVRGDPGKIVDAMIAAAEDVRAPLRLVLGSHAYASVTTALRERLRAVEAQGARSPTVDEKPGAGDAG